MIEGLRDVVVGICRRHWCTLIAVVAFLVGVSGNWKERVETPGRNIFSFGSQRKPFSLAAREIKEDWYWGRASDDAVPDCWVFRGNVTTGASLGGDWSHTQ